MKCNNCGADIQERYAFCIACGAPVPQPAPAQEINKKVNVFGIVSTAIAVLLAAALIIVLVLPGVGAGAGGERSFATPEDAIEYFVDCIRRQDGAGALAAFGTFSKAKGYDFEYLLNRVKAFTPYSNQPPTDYDFYVPLAQVQLRSRASQQIQMFVYSILLPEFDPLMSTQLKEGESSDILEDLDPSVLKDLKLLGAVLAQPDIQKSDNYKSNIKKQAATYGYEDLKDYLALYELDGKYYFGGFMIAKYEDGWRIDSLNSNLGGTPTMGTLTEVSREEIEYFIEENDIDFELP